LPGGIDSALFDNVHGHAFVTLVDDDVFVGLSDFYQLIDDVFFDFTR
jgi:hypothetical protein